jgi:hypothetical protein
VEKHVTSIFTKLKLQPPPEDIFEPVGIAFEREDLGVMDEPVDHRDGDLVPEDLTPLVARRRGVLAFS